MACVTIIKNETRTIREVLKEPDFNKFAEAMKKEIMDHESNNRFKIVPIISIGHTKAFKTTWAFKEREILTEVLISTKIECFFVVECNVGVKIFGKISYPWCRSLQIG